MPDELCTAAAAPVVVTVSVVPLGSMLHAGGGLPLPLTVQERLTVPEYPLRALTVMVDVAEPPGATDAGVKAVAVMEKSGAVAVVYPATKASVQGTLFPTLLVHVPPP
jgi:hypothetical protein